MDGPPIPPEVAAATREAFTPEQINDYLRQFTATVNKGREAEQLRAAMISIARNAYPEIYTQAVLAELTDVTQQGISHITKAGQRQLDRRTDSTYLLGRLLALALAVDDLGFGAPGRAQSAATASKIHRTWSVAPLALNRLVTLLKTDIAALTRKHPRRGKTWAAELAQITDLAGTEPAPDGNLELHRLLAAALTTGAAPGKAARPRNQTEQATIVEGYYAQRKRLADALG